MIIRQRMFVFVTYVIGEHLVLVDVHEHALVSGVNHEVLVFPVLEALEGVGIYDGGVAFRRLVRMAYKD